MPGTLPLLGMPWREQVSLARQAGRDRIDLLHSLCLTAPLLLQCPSVVTIHDTIWLNGDAPSHAQSAYRRLLRRYYRVVPAAAAKRASAIVTVSAASKESIVEHLEVDASKVFITYEAADPRFRPVPAERAAELLRRRGLQGDFVLAMGSADPRKNLSLVLEAYALLPAEVRTCHPLVVLCAHADVVFSVTRTMLRKDLVGSVRFLHDVSDEDLVSIYNAAAAFVFPSLREGFGLPLLEAMACGTPVAAANNSSIPEIAGDAALLFDEKDPREAAAAMIRTLTDGDLRASLRLKGFARAACYSWERCARQTIAVYRKVCGLPIAVEMRESTDSCGQAVPVAGR